MSEVTETPDLQGAYPRLSDAQIDALAALGQRRRTEPGQVLFAEGDRNCDFYVVLAGLVEVVNGRGTPQERVIGVHGRGRFLGELSLLTGETSYRSAVPPGRARCSWCRWTSSGTWSSAIPGSVSWCCAPTSSAARS